MAASITPASAASDAPIANVIAITKFGFTPISPATRGFSAVARIARPSRVRFTSNMRPIITAADKPITIILVKVTVASPKVSGRSGISCGNVMYVRPQTSIATVWITIDTPMAVMSGARRGALRSGR